LQKPPTVATVDIIRECSPRPWAGLNFNKLFTDATRIFSIILAHFSFLHLLLHFSTLFNERAVVLQKFILFPAEHKKNKRHHLELLFAKSFGQLSCVFLKGKNKIKRKKRFKDGKRK